MEVSTTEHHADPQPELGLKVSNGQAIGLHFHCYVGLFCANILKAWEDVALCSLPFRVELSPYTATNSLLEGLLFPYCSLTITP